MAFASVRSRTWTGTADEQFGPGLTQSRPLPSRPFRFSPQAKTVPSVRNAYALGQLPTTAETPVSPDTATGVRDTQLDVVHATPLPSWLYVLSPQADTVPSVLTA